MEERLSAVLSPYEGRKDALIPMLQKVQEELGYLPEEAMMVIARITGIGGSASAISRISSVPEPSGKPISTIATVGR